MNKELENKLLAFFAANSADCCIKPYLYKDLVIYHEYVDIGNGILKPHTFWGTPLPTVPLEEAKFIYAKKMLEKYKEFCNLIDSDE